MDSLTNILPMITVSLVMGIDFNKIKTLREKADLTQEQAAKRAGMSTRQAWNNIESGRQSPTVETLDRMAKALGTKTRDLLK